MYQVSQKKVHINYTTEDGYNNLGSDRLAGPKTLDPTN